MRTPVFEPQGSAGTRNPTEELSGVKRQINAMTSVVFGKCRRSGNGGPQTCLPAACGVAQRGPSTAHLH